MSDRTPANRQPLQHRYLRAADLARLRQLQFAPRHIMEGAYAGRHASPQRGRSVEFSDYRPYIPGDEVSDIDWKAFGRSDRLYVKLFEHQADLSLHLLVDGSASMAFRGLEAPPSRHDADMSRPRRLRLFKRKRASHHHPPPIGRPSKYDHACLMAGAIAFLTIQQQDRVAFALARQGLHAFHPSMGTMRHLNDILDTMAHHEPTGPAHLADTLHALARRAGRRRVLVLISDLLEEQEPIVQGLARFAHRGGEVIVFHVLHEDELHLPAWSDTRFVDSETGRHLRVNVNDVRQTYQREIQRTIESWRTALRARGMDYNLVSTATPYHRALESYLVRRAGARP